MTDKNKGHDWENLLVQFTESVAGQMVIEDGYGYTLSDSEIGPVVVVKAPWDYVSGISSGSPLPIISNEPKLEIM